MMFHSTQENSLAFIQINYSIPFIENTNLQLIFTCNGTRTARNLQQEKGAVPFLLQNHHFQMQIREDPEKSHHKHFDNINRFLLTNIQHKIQNLQIGKLLHYTETKTTFQFKKTNPRTRSNKIKRFALLVKNITVRIWTIKAKRFKQFSESIAARLFLIK